MRPLQVQGNVNPVNKKHYLAIDALRFFATFLVICFHYGFVMGMNPGGYARGASGGLVKFPELYGVSNFGWVGMQIFFVISGFVLTQGKAQAK